MNEYVEERGAVLRRCVKTAFKAAFQAGLEVEGDKLLFRRPRTCVFSTMRLPPGPGSRPERAPKVLRQGSAQGLHCESGPGSADDGQPLRFHQLSGCVLSSPMLVYSLQS